MHNAVVSGAYYRRTSVPPICRRTSIGFLALICLRLSGIRRRACHFLIDDCEAELSCVIGHEAR
jgi:hypothetical protein